MARLVELHLLQLFPPGKINANDLGEPKTFNYAGHTRAYASSQCFKRAARMAMVDYDLLKGDDLAMRVNDLVPKAAAEVARGLRDRKVDGALAQAVLKTAFLGLGLGFKKDEPTDRTEYLLFVPERTLGQLVDEVCRHWDVLRAYHDSLGTAGAAEPEGGEAKPPEGKSAEAKPAEAKARRGSAKKKEATDLFPADLRARLATIVFQRHKCAELALFSRMIADRPEHHITGAVNVAHALSTHRIVMDADYYVAIPENRNEGEQGAVNMGPISLCSPCLYRYTSVNLRQLAVNLAGADQADAPETAAYVARTLSAYLQGFGYAMPTGKQASMTSRPRPGFILARVSDTVGAWQLTEAFAKPARVDAGGDVDLLGTSAVALDVHLAEQARAYPRDVLATRRVDWLAVHDEHAKRMVHLSGKTPEGESPYALAGLVHRAPSFDALVSRVVTSAVPETVGKVRK
jgi:CRISPR system Cascade subunit CasC